LKPANILIDRHDIAKIADFGLARIRTDEIRQRLSLSIGTQPYRAPEILLGIRYGAAIDIWSFGVIFFEALTGTLLEDGDRKSHTAMTVARSILAMFMDMNTTNLIEESEVIMRLHEMMRSDQKKKNKLVRHNFQRFLDDNLTELVEMMLIVNPDRRPTSRQIVEHKFFANKSMHAPVLI
jgi:serine/threonine protein kinase